MNRVILVGFMGAGKTTVGKALAKDLGIDFYDLDWYIESRRRKTVPQLFAEYGEEGFRKIEHYMLHEAAEFENIVLSCGGGTPCWSDNMDYLNRQGDTIYLKAAPEVIATHLRMGKTVRPLLAEKTPEERETYIQQELEKRAPIYEKAHYTLDVSLMDSYDKIQITVQQIRNLLAI